MTVEGSLLRKTWIALWVAALAIPPLGSAQSPAPAQNEDRRSETGLPYVDCYAPEDYNGAAQTWVFEQDNRGVLYAGNNIGVLEFDGSTWRRITVGKGDVVRALDRDASGRIFVGSTGDFGYLDDDAVGAKRYVSLLDLVPESERDFNDIWAIHATDAGVYFLARERLFRLLVPQSPDDGAMPSVDTADWKLASWTPDARYLFSFWHDGTYYVHEGGVGLMRMVGDALQLVPGGEQFANERVQVMLPRPDGARGFVLGSFNGGLFTYDGSRFSVFRSDVNPFARSRTLYKGAVLQDGSYALATLDGGLAITDNRGQKARILDLSLGLPSNSTIAVFVDREGALWFSPENGICRVELPSSLSYYDASNGLIGGSLHVVRHRGTLYAAASNGTFWLDKQRGGFRSIDLSARGNPQSFALMPFDEQLLVATGTGVYRIDGDRATIVKENVGGAFASTGLHRSKLDESVVFVGLIDGVVFLRLTPQGRLVSETRLAGVRHDIWQFAEPQPGTLWMGTRTDGALRVSYSTDPWETHHIEKFGVESGLPEGAALVYEAAGEVFFATKTGVFAFDEASGRFARAPELDIVEFDGSQEEYYLAEAPNGDVWVGAGREAAVARKQADGSFVPETTPILHVSDVAAAVIYPDDNGVVWFGGTESLLRFDPSVPKSYSSTYAALVRRVTIRGDSIIFGGSLPAGQATGGPQLEFRDNGMRFHYAAATFERPSKTRFRTILEGFDDQWSPWTTETRRDYTNLPPGDYTFRVRAMNVYGHESSEASFALAILPPWYRTLWAYVLYAVGLGAVIFVVDRVQRRRLISRERERAHLREAELRAESAEAEAKNVELLSQIGRDITSTLSIEKIIETVYENVNNLMDASVFSIGILNEEESRLEFLGSKEKGLTMPSFFYDLHDDRLATWCYHNRKEVVIQDYSTDHLKYLKADQAPVSGETSESVLYVPLIHKNRVIGVISAQSFKKNAYSDYHLNILRNLATYTAIAIDNAEAYQRLNVILDDLRAAQDRLVQSEKMASLGQLTAGIAHEIKNPLNFVNNFAAVSAELTEELVEEIDKNLDKKLAEVADELREILADLKINAGLINEHGKRADGIVKSMLQHSRGDHTEQSATDVNALLEEYVTLAYHGMRAADSDFNSSIERDYDEAVGSVNMVPQEIGRVLINLLNNAFYAVNERAKASEPGYEPTVSVSTKRRPGGVEIGVRDNGTGIPDSVKAKIFEPFFTTKPTGSGTGLGLSMSYDIISKGHGGDLRVDSKAGEFTHFVITLPG